MQQCKKLIALTVLMAAFSGCMSPRQANSDMPADGYCQIWRSRVLPRQQSGPALSDEPLAIIRGEDADHLYRLCTDSALVPAVSSFVGFLCTMEFRNQADERLLMVLIYNDGVVRACAPSDRAGEPVKNPSGSAELFSALQGCIPERIAEVDTFYEPTGTSVGELFREIGVRH
jgi:hypothetical protein